MSCLIRCTLPSAHHKPSGKPASPADCDAPRGRLPWTRADGPTLPRIGPTPHGLLDPAGPALGYHAKFRGGEIRWYRIRVRWALTVPSGNERGPQYADQALAAIHQGNPDRLPFVLEICRVAGELTLACDLPDELRAVTHSQLYAAYPDAHLRAIPDEATPSPDTITITNELHLERDLFPIKRYTQFEDALNRVSAEPLTALFLSLATDRNDSLETHIAIEVRPATSRRRRQIETVLHRRASPFFRHHHRLAHWYADFATSPRRLRRVAAWTLGRLGHGGEPHERELSTTSGRLHDREDDIQAAADKLGKHLFEVHIRLIVTAPRAGREEAESKLREIGGAFGQFSVPRLASFHATRSEERRHRGRGFLLSTEELATLWHPPTKTVQAPALGTVQSRELPAPVDLPSRAQETDLAILGSATFRGRSHRFGILEDDRRRHLALVGKTGQGKTTLLHHLIASDIKAGRGVALLDPHGDLCDALLGSIPRARINDVILFDAADRDHPLSFNLLHCPNPEMRPLVASGIVSAFKKLYGEFWGPRMEHILRNALLALLELPGATLVSLVRWLSDGRFREMVVARVTDPVVAAFWQREFAGLPAKLRAEALSPIQNKIGHFVSSPLLRNVLGQSGRSLDLRSVLDSNRVLLVNLSKGRMGDDASSLLGSLLVTALQLAALSRADTAEADRGDFFLYIDEFQNFATDSLATILSEARKYRLALTVANQYLDQLDEETAAALFGNVGTLVSFQVGPSDAEALATQFGPELSPHDLLRLPRFKAYVRLLIAGQPSPPFSMHTLPPQPTTDSDRAEVVRRVSHRRYTRPAQDVEAEIRKTLGVGSIRP